MNRWCIIAGARTGSSWLEDLIFNGLPSLHNFPALKLGEFLSEDWIMYSNSLGINLSIKEDILSTYRKEYMNNIINFLENNQEQSAVMRIFIQPHLLETKTPLENIVNLLIKIKKMNFNFIFLKRNLFNRIISAIVAHKTSKWKTLETDSKMQILNSNCEPIFISPEDFTYQFNYTSTQIKITEEILKTCNITGITINYENLKEDCLINNITLGQYSIYAKTYTKPYTELISNYYELQTLFENLNKNGK